MKVRDLVDYLEGCADEAEVRIAICNTLFDVEIEINSELNLVLTVKGHTANCVVCGKIAVAAPFAKQLICYEHWNSFKEK